MSQQAVKQVYLLQRYLARDKRLSSVLIRPDEPPHMLGYSGGVYPASNAPTISRETAKLIAHLANTPARGSAPESPPPYLVRVLEYFGEFYGEGGDGAEYRFRVTVSRSGSGLMTYMSVIRPQSEIPDALASCVGRVTATDLSMAGDARKASTVSVGQAADMILGRECLVVISSKQRTVAALFGNALVAELSSRPTAAGIVTAEGNPLFSLASGRISMMRYELPTDVPDVQSVVSQAQIMATARLFYTDTPEAFDATPSMVPAVAGKAVIAVSGGGLRGTETLFKKYQEKNTILLDVAAGKA